MGATDQAPMVEPLDEQVDHVRGEPGAALILEYGDTRPFAPFDRFTQMKEPQSKSLEQLLDEFASLRNESLATLKTLNLQPNDLARPGRHPSLGSVTLPLAIVARKRRCAPGALGGGPWIATSPGLDHRAQGEGTSAARPLAPLAGRGLG